MSGSAANAYLYDLNAELCHLIFLFGVILKVFKLSLLRKLMHACASLTDRRQCSQIGCCQLGRWLVHDNDNDDNDDESKMQM